MLSWTKSRCKVGQKKHRQQKIFFELVYFFHRPLKNKTVTQFRSDVFWKTKILNAVSSFFFFALSASTSSKVSFEIELCWQSVHPNFVLLGLNSSAPFQPKTFIRIFSQNFIKVTFLFISLNSIFHYCSNSKFVLFGNKNSICILFLVKNFHLKNFPSYFFGPIFEASVQGKYDC